MALAARCSRSPPFPMGSAGTMGAPGGWGRRCRGASARGRFPVLPWHAGEEEQEWVDGVHGAEGDGAVTLLGASTPPPLPGPAIQPSDPTSPGFSQREKQPVVPEHKPSSRGSREPWRDEFSPEQMMKAGVLPRRARVLLKQSKRGRFSQGSVASHRTGKWLLGSGSAWPRPSTAVPQPRARQRRVASSGDTPGLAATAPHSPSLCSSRKPKQLESPSTSCSLAGPAEGWRGRGGGRNNHLVTHRDVISSRY